jgi:hypothetical protein
MKKTTCGFVLLFAFIPGIVSQSNQSIDTLLNEDPASFGSTAVFILSASGMIEQDAPVESAMRAVALLNRRLGERDPLDPVRTGEFSLMVMRAFDLQGGIWYSITHSKRYAFRELAYLGFLERKDGPFRRMSGEDVLSTLSRVVNWIEETEAQS